MTPEISIIIPVYNCEKFLHQCLQSVAEQSFKNIEVLCVDNASTDNSPTIIKDFAAKHSNFFYFYKKGGMAGGARNEGLKHAKGKYVLFYTALRTGRNIQKRTSGPLDRDYSERKISSSELCERTQHQELELLDGGRFLLEAQELAAQLQAPAELDEKGQTVVCNVLCQCHEPLHPDRLLSGL